MAGRTSCGNIPAKFAAWNGHITGFNLAAHDLRQLYSVRRTTSGRFDYPRRLAEILRTDCGGCNHAQPLHVYSFPSPSFVS
jgi:hypothetical protein